MANHIQALIVGGGVSGLVCTYALRKAGVDALLVEASARPGGLICSERRDGYLLERGPQSFSSTPQILELCRELGIQDHLVDAPPRAPRFLLINGRLRPVPLGPPAFFASSLFSLSTKGKILRDVLGSSTPSEGDESVAVFVRRKFSAELLDKLVGPFVSGIYAGDAERLSLRAAFPQLHEAERIAGSIVRGIIRAAKSKPKPRHKSTLQSFRDGNEILVKALAANLGSALRTETSVVEITGDSQPGGSRAPETLRVTLSGQNSTEQITAEHLILATPTDVCASLLCSFAPEVSAALDGIEYAPVAVVALGYAKSAVAGNLDGFGFLVPRSENLRTLGTVWNSSLFPNRAPDGHSLLTSFVGGATDPATTSLPTDDISALVHREVSTILQIQSPPTFSNVTVYARALPQYNLGHTDRVAAIRSLTAKFPNIFLTGNYFSGPSIGSCVEHALSTAELVLAHLKSTSGLAESVRRLPKRETSFE